MVSSVLQQQENNLFLPDAARATTLNHHMHQELRASLSHIVERLQSNDYSAEAQQLEAVCGKLDAQENLPPLLFGLYYRLSFALLNHHMDEALSVIDKMSALDMLSSPSITLLAMNNSRIHAYEDVYMACLGEKDGFTLIPPSPVEYTTFQRVFSSVMEQVIRQHDALTSEMQTLLCQIVVADAPENTQPFNGMAPYQLWRMLFLNVSNAASPAKMLETLLHETAHIYLFGHTIDAPLVLNDPQERYFSPIRGCERPMDGIYHAMFVTARVAYLLEQLAPHIPDVIQEEYADMSERIARNKHIYRESLQAVKQDAKLSEQGANLLQDVEAVMG